MQNRTLWVAGSLVMGFLQAWDSGGLQAPPFAQVLIAAGVIAPAAAIGLSANFYARVSALIAAAALLAWARIVTPVSLNALHIGLMVPAIYILFVCRWEEIRAAKTAS
jgi:hypothetical protein